MSPQTDLIDDQPAALDPRQTTRIEAVHRGFLYQHLYAVGCLLLAEKHEVTSVSVERDEDIELQHAGRTYIQVKTRIKPIIPSDIVGALERFDTLRTDHESGLRCGKAQFFVVMNQPPGPVLLEAINSGQLSEDVKFIWPGFGAHVMPALPPAWSGIDQAAEWCAQLAAKLPYSLISPESLVWKLAGCVQLASSGSTPYLNHTFKSDDLKALFEQLIVKMQAFPAPPAVYRPQRNEPSLDQPERVRIICAFSGSGKTSWASESAMHSTSTCAYYDVGDLPGPAIASSLVRELAPLVLDAESPEIRKVLALGSTGNESLQVLDEYIGRHNIPALVVLDNAHRVPSESLRTLIESTRNLKLVLLSHPGPTMHEIAALLGLTQETLLGWDVDSIAAEAQHLGVQGSAGTFKNLNALTAGMPLYVQSALRLSKTHYRGDLAKLCLEVSEQSNVAETAQEIILSKVFNSLSDPSRNALSVWSLVDVGMTKGEVCNLLQASVGMTNQQSLALLRLLRAQGIVQAIDADQLKIHDSLRLLGRRHLHTLARAVTQDALQHLRTMLFRYLAVRRNPSRLATLISVLLQLEDVEAIIGFAGEELFHEMGPSMEFMSYLDQIAISPQVEPTQRFWALDGLIFSDVKNGRHDNLTERFDQMRRLIEDYALDSEIQATYYMKLMLHHAQFGRADLAHEALSQVRDLLPDKPIQRRVLQYNAATSFCQLGNLEDSLHMLEPVIEEYFAVLGFNLPDIAALPPEQIWERTSGHRHAGDNIKRLADALELRAKLCTDMEPDQLIYRFSALNLYEMVGAIDSQIRVGQDLADDMSARGRFDEAKQVIERLLLPLLAEHGMVDQAIGVRSQYAVFLAYCEEFDAADAEMTRLMPYSAGFTRRQRQEIQEQLKIIHNCKVRYVCRVEGVLPTIVEDGSADCPCGSGKTFSECHGAFS
ncbi:SEC-C metal-binding domain-containing protein [Pseudomonas hormoni]|jgi:tetratricopeptide (TPR) repeat protein